MTFGGGVDGIGLDVIGLGDVGVSLISVEDCNEEGDCESEDLSGEHEYCAANSLCDSFKYSLVMPVALVEVTGCGRLHLAKVGAARLCGLQQLTTEETDMDPVGEQRRAAFPDT